MSFLWCCSYLSRLLLGSQVDGCCLLPALSGYSFTITILRSLLGGVWCSWWESPPPQSWDLPGFIFISFLAPGCCLLAALSSGHSLWPFTRNDRSCCCCTTIYFQKCFWIESATLILVRMELHLQAKHLPHWFREPGLYFQDILDFFFHFVSSSTSPVPPNMSSLP